MRADSPARRWSDGSTSSGVRVKRTREEAVRHHSNPPPQERRYEESESRSGSLPPPQFDASFRVYTPHEMKDAPLRASFRPPPSLGEELNPGALLARSPGTRHVLKWLGLGVGAGALLLTFILVAFSLSDDTPTTTKSYAATPATKLATTPATPTPAPVDTAGAADTANPNDFELPDDAPVGAGRAASKRGAKQKRR